MRFDLISTFGLIAPAVISGTTFYMLGYISFLGNDAVVFLDAHAITNLVFQFLLPCSLAVGTVLVIIRTSLNETSRDTSTLVVLSQKPLVLFPMAILVLTLVADRFAPNVLFGNVWFPIGGLIFS